MKNQSGEVNMRSLRENPIIFFDGVCGMCNGFVDLVLRGTDWRCGIAAGKSHTLGSQRPNDCLR